MFAFLLLMTSSSVATELQIELDGYGIRVRPACSRQRFYAWSDPGHITLTPIDRPGGPVHLVATKNQLVQASIQAGTYTLLVRSPLHVPFRQKRIHIHGESLHIRVPLQRLSDALDVRHHSLVDTDQTMRSTTLPPSRGLIWNRTRTEQTVVVLEEGQPNRR